MRRRAVGDEIFRCGKKAFEGHFEDSVEGRLCSPAISGTKQRCAGVKKKMWGVENKTWGRGGCVGRGPGAGLYQGIEKKHRVSKKRVPIALRQLLRASQTRGIYTIF